MNSTSTYATSAWLSLLLFLFIGASTSASPSVRIKPTPKWVLPLTPAGKAPSPKDYSDGYYLAFTDTQVNLDLQTAYHRTIRHIVTESGVQNGSEVAVTFDPSYEQINFHSLIIWRNGQALSQLLNPGFKVMPLEVDRQRFIYNGYYSASITLKDVRKGDRIELSYSRTGWNPAFKNKYSEVFNFGVYDYVPHIHYALITSKGRALQFKEGNAPPSKSVKTSKDKIIYEWELKDAKVIPYEAHTPSWFSNNPFVQVTEYNSWKEVVEWGRSFYEFSPVSGALKSKIEQWKKNANGSMFAYLEQAVHFVQDDIRYFGIETGENSHRPHSPEVVFSQRFGDCKDKALLLCAILKANQIECDPVLVDTYKKGHIADYLPSPLLFNHVVVRVKTGKDAYTFIDATNLLQGGTTSKFYFPPYGKGLLLKQGQHELLSIPDQNPGYVTVQEELVLPAYNDSTNEGTLTIKTVYYDSEADLFRGQWQQSTIAETEESFLNYYRDTYSHAEFKALDTLEYYDQREANNFSMVERYTMKNGWQYDSTRGKYTFIILGKILYNQLVHLPNRPRTSPVALNYPYHLQYTIQVRLPESWNIAAEQWSVERDAYEIHVSSQPPDHENVWELSYEYKVLKDHLTAEESVQYRRDVERLVESLEYELSTPGVALSELQGLNIWTILFMMLVIMGSVWFCVRLNRYSPTAGLETPAGIPIGGWLTLVGISLFVIPFELLDSIFTSKQRAYFMNADWDAFQGELALKEWSFQVLHMVEAVSNWFFLCVSVLIIYLFFKRRDIFPTVFVRFLVANMIFIIVDTILAHVYFDLDEQGQTLAMQDILWQGIYAAIWVLYMQRSERVKQTFVRAYSRKEATNVETEVILPG